MGSAAIAALIAQVAFWLLLVCGWAAGELRARGTALFVLLWLGGRASLHYAGGNAPSFFSPWVAALDIVLVFRIFKGDVRLS